MFRILQVSTVDVGGGAEKVAYNLFQKYRDLGHKSWLAVGYKRSIDPDVLLIPDSPSHTSRTNLVWFLRQKIQPLRGHIPGIGFLSQSLEVIIQPRKIIDQQMGREDFNFPGTKRLLDLPSAKPDVVHCHNLHGGYFDLRELPNISKQVPVLLTLHDAWLLSGHCAHSFNCEKWKTGCGQCPDLTIYPAVKKDATAYNWRRKKEIFAKSKLYIATPSNWLMQKVQQSILAPAVIEAKVIPNGVDLSIFHPAEKQEARKTLSIPKDAKVLLFTANGIRQNIWKDYKTLRAAVSHVAENLNKQKVLFIALGENAPPEKIGQAEVRFIPYQKDSKVVANYYQAADIYLHASRADTFPNTVLESLACGTPVIATAVGGIPEQIENKHTGFLVPEGDAEMMAERILDILSDDKLHKHLSGNAVESARSKFDSNNQVNEYLSWYQKILERSG